MVILRYRMVLRQVERDESYLGGSLLAINHAFGSQTEILRA
jgi:hypothetical protein